MNIDKAKLGEAVRMIRLQKNLSQAGLAELSSLAPNSIARMERGELGISMKSINAIAKGLQLPASFLMVMATEDIGISKSAGKLLDSFRTAVHDLLDE